MDTDWCLTCGRHTEGKSYCSRACRERDNLTQQPCYVAPSTSGDSDSDLDLDASSRRISQLKRHPQQQQHISVVPTPSRQLRTAAASTTASSSRARAHHHHHHQQQQRQESVHEEPMTSARWPGNSRDGIRAWASQIPAHSEPDVVPCPAQAVTGTSSTVRPAFKLSQQRMAPPALSTCTTQPARTSASASSSASPSPLSATSPPIDTPPRRYSASPASSTATTMQTESIATPASDDAAPPADVVVVRGHHAKAGACVLDGITARLANWGTKGLHATTPAKAFKSTTTHPAFTVVSTAHAQSAWEDEELLYPTTTSAAFDKPSANTSGVAYGATSNANSKPMWISSTHQPEGYGCGFGYGYWTGNAAGEQAAREMRRPVVVPAVADAEKIRERERELAFCQRGRKTARSAAKRT